MEHEGKDYTNRDLCIRYRIIKGFSKGFSKGTGGLGIWRTSGDHPNNTAENVQNTEKSLGDLKRLAVTQTPVKDHQLTLM